MGKSDSRGGPFRGGEKVLVPHTDKYYEAKALKAQKREDGVFYYLCHYQGWNKKWDEWIEAPGLVKFDPKLKTVDLSQPEKGKGGGGPGGGREVGKPLKKRSIAQISFQEEDHGNQVSVVLPLSLKKVLVDDWEQIRQNGMLVPLPRKLSVTDILAKFVEENKKDTGVVDQVEEVADGLRIYFDKALQLMLLYNEERKQAEKVLADGSTPSSVYGGEHLLRLLVKLPELLSMTYIVPEHQAVLQSQLALFVAFLQSKSGEVFLPVSQYKKLVL